MGMEISHAPHHSLETFAGDSSEYTEENTSAGTLIIVIMRARNLHNRRAISKQNPFCTVRVAGNSAQTKTILRGGQQPTWDHEVRFQLDRDADNQFLKLGVFDEDGRSSDLIGDARIPLQPAYSASVREGFDSWFPIKYNGRYVGEVYLEMTWYPCKSSRCRSSQSSHSRSRAYSLSPASSSCTSLRSHSVSPSKARSTPTLTTSRPLPPLPCEPENASSDAILDKSIGSINSTNGILDKCTSFYEQPTHSAPELSGVPQLSSTKHLHSRIRTHALPNVPIPHTPTNPAQLLGAHPAIPGAEVEDQDDISRQINDRYGASMFERIRPRH